MSTTFKTFHNRRDSQLISFSADDNAELLAAICTNSATAHVRQLSEGGPVSVPSHKAADVSAHLVKLGWTNA